jgi:hypothetical protein
MGVGVGKEEPATSVNAPVFGSIANPETELEPEFET